MGQVLIGGTTGGRDVEFALLVYLKDFFTMGQPRALKPINHHEAFCKINHNKCLVINSSFMHLDDKACFLIRDYLSMQEGVLGGTFLLMIENE